MSQNAQFFFYQKQSVVLFVRKLICLIFTNFTVKEDVKSSIQLLSLIYIRICLFIYRRIITVLVPLLITTTFKIVELKNLSNIPHLYEL